MTTRLAPPHSGSTDPAASVRRGTNLLDLFSGIGGFSLGLERAGFKTVAFCEIEAFPRRVLAHHWPGIPIYDDVRNLDAARLRSDGIERIDAICGGFPCQDISLAGKGAGLDGERSGLWREFARLVGELRPSVVFVENVGALRARGLASVLGDLAAIGYDAQWHVVPAAAVGAPHLRERVWIVAVLADAAVLGCGRRGPAAERQARADLARCDGAEPDAATADAAAQRRGKTETFAGVDCQGRWAEADGCVAADADGRRCQCFGLEKHSEQQGAPGLEPERLGSRGWRGGSIAADAQCIGRPQLFGLQRRLARALTAASTPWERTTEPPLCGLDDGVPARVARPQLKALGNAVVPQIPEILGRAVMGIA